MDTYLDTLGEQIAEDAAHLDAAQHRVLTKLRIFDEGQGWYRQGFRSCAQWLSWRVGWSRNTAREHVRVANALAKLPKIDEALRKGELSFCKVRAMTRIATPENESLLVEWGPLMTGNQLDQLCRKYAMVQRLEQPNPRDDNFRREVTRHDRDDGMVVIRAVLHPEEAAEVWTALQRVAADRCRPNCGELGETKTHPDFSRADALVDMARTVVRGDTPNRSPTEIMITIPLETLQQTAAHDADEVGCCADGTAIPVQAARRLACDAGVILAADNERGDILKLAAKRRTISGALKRALLRRDDTCRFPGCQSRVFLEGHHMKHWIDGGETVLGNVLSLCGHHHRFVHEYGFAIELREDGTVVAFRPDGRQLLPIPPTPTTPDLGWPNILRRNEKLAITADTIDTADGSRIDWDFVIPPLFAADERAASAEAS